MLHPRRFLVDTNVWIAYLMGSEPHCAQIVELFRAVQQCGGFLLYAPTTLKDVFYLVPRQLYRLTPSPDVEQDQLARRNIAWACIETIDGLATAAPLSAPECKLARMLRARHADIEDNLIVAAAESCKADYIVTYDQQLIKHFYPACLTPEQACGILHSETSIF